MIVVLSPKSVASNNVMDEVSYALEENKLVIPVLHKDCNIPFRLRRVQRIDFTADYDTGFSDLMRALGIEQPAPAPAPAEAEAQVAEEEALRKPEAEARQKAEEQVAQKVEAPLAETPKVPESKPPKTQTPKRPPKQPAPTATSRKTTPHERMIGALVGTVAGAIFGSIIFATASEVEIEYLLVWAVILGIAGAIAGAISGTHRKVIGIALVVGLIGWIVAAILFEKETNYVHIGGLLGVPLGAILGAITGVILKKRLGWA